VCANPSSPLLPPRQQTLAMSSEGGRCGGLRVCCGLLTSPRAFALLNLASLAIGTVGSLVFLALGFPRAIFACDGITAGTLFLGGLALGSHILFTIWFAPALGQNVWPWIVVDDIHVRDDSDDEGEGQGRGNAAGQPAPTASGKSGATNTEATPLLGATPAAAVVPVDGGGAGGNGKAPATRSRFGRKGPSRRTWWQRNGTCVSRGCLYGVCGVAVVVLWAFACIGVWLRNTTLPVLEGTLSVTGIGGTVSLFHDQDSGVVHVSVPTRSGADHSAEELDAYFGQGFAHAQLRMWQVSRDAAVAAPSQPLRRGTSRSNCEPPLTPLRYALAH